MRIYPAPHYTMGGLWVDYNLMSNVPGLFVIGEANFSDHGANRLGASALMQGLADGYFILPYTIGTYFASKIPALTEQDRAYATNLESEQKAFFERMVSVKGNRTVESFHRELGKLMWDYCGMARNEAGLRSAIEKIQSLREDFEKNVNVSGSSNDLNMSLEHAGRLTDYFELAQLMCLDALHRTESCGGHFREESQTEEGEAKRDDQSFCYVGVWDFAGAGKTPTLHKEPLSFDNVQLVERSYK